MTGVAERPEHIAEGDAVLAQCQIECGALEGPATVVDRGGLVGLALEQRLLGQMLGERVQRPVTRQRKQRPAHLLHVVLEGVVRDVLAEAHLAVPVQANHRRLAQETTGHVLFEPVECVAVHGQRHVPDSVVEAHPRPLPAVALSARRTRRDVRLGI